MEEKTQVEQIEITPQAAMKWADYKRETSLEIIRAQYELKSAELELAKIEAGHRFQVERQADELPKEDKSPSNAEKRDLAVQQLMELDPTATKLNNEANDLREKIEYLKIEKEHAREMYELTLGFAYWSDLSTKEASLDALVNLTETSREAVHS